MRKRKIFVGLLSLFFIGAAAPKESGTYGALDSLPVHWRDRMNGDCPVDPAKPDEAVRTCGIKESAEQRAERLRGVAAAIDAATAQRWKRRLLVAVLKHETGLARVGQECQLRGDSGKAIGLWQSWAHKECVSVEEQAKQAAKHLSMAMNYCRQPGDSQEKLVFKGVSLYATGSRCSWIGARKRLRTWKWAMAQK